MDDEDCSIVSESLTSRTPSLPKNSVKGRVPLSQVGKISKKKRKVSKENLPSKTSKVLRSDKSNDLTSPKSSKKKLMEVSTMQENNDNEELSEEQPEEKENVESAKCSVKSGNKSFKSKGSSKVKNDASIKGNVSMNLPQKRKRSNKLNASPRNATPTANPIFKMFKKIGEKKQKENLKCDDKSTNDDVMIIDNPESELEENLEKSKCKATDGMQNSSSENISTANKNSNNDVSTANNILPVIDIEALVPVIAKKKSSGHLPKTSALDNSIGAMNTSDSNAVDIKSPATKRKSMTMKRKLTPNQVIKSEEKKRKQEKVEESNREETKPKEMDDCELNEKKLGKEELTSSVPPEDKEHVEGNKSNDDVSEIICEPDVALINTPSTSSMKCNADSYNPGIKKSLKQPKKRQRKCKQQESPDNEKKNCVANNTIFNMFKKIEMKENKESPDCDNNGKDEDDDILIVYEPEKNSNFEKPLSSLLDVSKKASTSDDSTSEKDTNSRVSALCSSTPITDAVTPISSKKRAEFSTPKTPVNDFSIDRKDTPSSKASDSSPVVLNKTPTMKQKMTPKQILRDSEKKKKQEEREQIKLEKELLKLGKEKEKKQKEEERQQAKEEKQKIKLEETEIKKLKKEEDKQKKEEERLKKEEEKLKKEEEKQKKEEEKQRKEEERIKKEEEKKFQEEEALEKKKKEKEKFAQFFVPKKIESPIVAAEQVRTNLPGPFMKFQVKENMRMAPIIRENNFSDERKSYLDSFIKSEVNNKNKNYLEILKDISYFVGKSCKTYPAQEKSLDNECEIVDDDEEEISGTDIMEESKGNLVSKNVKAKFLQFCENKRPAYFGSWSKKPLNASGRNPFGKEKIFDYAYDSDEDWEEEETGESLSDSEGEAEGEDAGEENDQYEVDNDVFVPHGYLSDDEGKDDDNEVEEEVETGFKDETMQKEQLKIKQMEFDFEMKQKTKQLKPKVYGCVWMGDKSSHTAYDQLIKILSGHRAMVFFGSCPIDLKPKNPGQEETVNNEDEEVDESGKLKFAKSFPEKAVPDLIRLIHGNPHTKRHLIREFSEFWKNKCLQENSGQDGCIALRKIEPKIQELGTYGRYSEDGVHNKGRTWFVLKSIRGKYGLSDLEITNNWTYTIPPKVKTKEEKDNRMSVEKEENDEKIEKCVDDLSHSAKRSSAINLITRFTKLLSEEEKEELMKKNISETDNNSADVKTPSLDITSCCELKKKQENLRKTPSTSTPGNKAKLKKKIHFISAPLNSLSPKPVNSKNSIVSFLQNKEKDKEKPESDVLSGKESSDPVITID